ncbi:MAG: hypothetical protein SchgKO_04760 [Schleiferiaceae bacterium]
MKRFGVIGLLLLLFLFSCENEIDTTPPYFTTVTVNSIEGDVTESAPGTLGIRVYCGDDTRLGQLQIEIHSNFDGHDHGKVQATPFYYSQVVNLSGTNQNVNKVVNIPANAASGPYHMNFRLSDHSGNQATPIYRNLEIESPSQATIDITFPDFSSEVNLPSNSNLLVLGTIEDDSEIEEITIVCDHLTSFTEIYSETWDLSGLGITSWDINSDGNVKIPLDDAVGICELTIKVVDSDGNVTRVENEFTVEP